MKPWLQWQNIDCKQDEVNLTGVCVKLDVYNKMLGHLYELPTDEVGEERFDPYLLKYEGFSGACWADAKAKGKSLGDIETEIMSDWKDKGKIIDYGWTHGGDEFGEDEIFYAILYGKNEVQGG